MGLTERMRAGMKPRAVGLALALLLEALLLLLLLSLGTSGGRGDQEGEIIASFNARDFANPEPPAPESEQPEQVEDQPVERPETVAEAPATPTPPRLTPPAPRDTAPTPPAVELPRDETASFEIAPAPAPSPRAAPAQGPMGPADTRRATPDTPRVGGSGPNGEPLYAAAWYREPRDDELRGYLSTAQGPGWGLIACRTVPDYRVEDCVMIDESPAGSNIARSVLAAAWQFRVRPPRIGGRVMVGEWVRIRIDYDLRPR